ncbi:hypothetical protein F4859DRAFT_282856 [Xylaria cf. heliscus]|nr:hypothetical protein F4859DRAFT_282856 [Xylaria cf. heliscus]
MKLFTIIALQTMLSGILAAPVPDNNIVEAKTRPSLMGCDHFVLDEDGRGSAYLHAECRGDGPGTKVYSGLDLNKCLTNFNGDLYEEVDGKFAKSCKDIIIRQYDTKDKVVLSAICGGGPRDTFTNRVSSINLVNIVVVDDGELACIGS